MILKATQCGNSIVVRIPRTLAKKKGISVDSTVEIGETENGIIIRPVGKKKYSLKELLKGVTPQNRHSEVDFGCAVGKELIHE